MIQRPDRELGYFACAYESRSFWGTTIMPKENCLIVLAAGRRLDLMRGEASRIAKESHADWWSDRGETGTRFCFVDAKAKEAFAETCDNLGIACREA